MDWKQALTNLDQAVASISANRQTHATLIESVKTIQDEILGGEAAKKELAELKPKESDKAAKTKSK